MIDGLCRIEQPRELALIVVADFLDRERVATIFGRFNASLRVRYLGPRPLTEDNIVRSPATTVVNLRAARRFGPVEVTAEMLNICDTARADADYYYASRLPGEPVDGIEGVHSRTVEPRMLRIGATITL